MSIEQGNHIVKKIGTYLEHFERNLLLNTVTLDHVMINKVKKQMFADLTCEVIISSNL